MKTETSGLVGGSQPQQVAPVYTLVEGIDGVVVLQEPRVENAVARAYDPGDEIVQITKQLSEIQDGGADGVLAFVSTYGLLGRPPLLFKEKPLYTAGENGKVQYLTYPPGTASLSPNQAVPTPRRVRDDEKTKFWRTRHGDPLWWCYAHAATVRWCLAVIHDLNPDPNDEQPSERNSGPPTQGIVAPAHIAIRDDYYDFGAIWEGETIVWSREVSRGMLNKVINENISGVRRTLQIDANGNASSRFDCDSLIERIYWCLADTRECGRVYRCENEDCRALFIQTRPNQRFCLKAKGEKESKCSSRKRVHKYRSDPKNRDTENENQRKRYEEKKSKKLPS